MCIQAYKVLKLTCELIKLNCNISKGKTNKYGTLLLTLKIPYRHIKRCIKYSEEVICAWNDIFTLKCQVISEQTLKWQNVIFSHLKFQLVSLQMFPYKIYFQWMCNEGLKFSYHTYVSWIEPGLASKLYDHLHLCRPSRGEISVAVSTEKLFQFRRWRWRQCFSLKLCIHIILHSEAQTFNCGDKRRNTFLVEVDSKYINKYISIWGGKEKKVVHRQQEKQTRAKTMLIKTESKFINSSGST